MWKVLWFGLEKTEDADLLAVGMRDPMVMVVLLER